MVEVGAGNGMNFPHYPPEVTEVLAVEPEPYLREKAEQAAAAAPVPVTVVDGLADALPAEDARSTPAWRRSCCARCPSRPRALAELRRVIRPGGELRFYEHVLSQDAKRRGGRTASSRCARFSGGCHPNRDTPAAIEAAGFKMERCERFTFKPGPLMKAIEPHVIGTARRA